MHKKALKYKDEDAAKQDPFGGPVLDPFTMLTRQMLDDILRREIKGMLRSELNQSDKKGTIISNYALEASFIPYFTIMLKKQMKATIIESVYLLTVGEVVEDIFNRASEQCARDAMQDIVAEAEENAPK
jgi:hypothetical protein